MNRTGTRYLCSRCGVSPTSPSPCVWPSGFHHFVLATLTDKQFARLLGKFVAARDVVEDSTVASRIERANEDMERIVEVVEASGRFEEFADALGLTSGRFHEIAGRES